MYLSFTRHHTCAVEGCEATWTDYSGVSKYCEKHRKETARARKQKSGKKYHRRQREMLLRSREMNPQKCAWCGKDLPAVRPPNTRYCIGMVEKSPCYTAANNEAAKKRNAAARKRAKAAVEKTAA